MVEKTPRNEKSDSTRFERFWSELRERALANLPPDEEPLQISPAPLRSPLSLRGAD
jgi:hypothetical protein